MNCDIAIVGAGPSGLCLARALAGLDLDIQVFDGAERSALEAPADDGREIALTHPSRALLERLGIWQRIDSRAVSDLRDAHIFDGRSEQPLRIRHSDGGAEQLGWLVGNHHIRRAAFQSVVDQPGLSIHSGCRVEQTRLAGQMRELTLSDGRVVRASLVVAADSRHSSLRRSAGIGARMRDFGRSMLLVPVTIERDHQHIAWEWFDYERTLAMLPMTDQRASCVVTLPHQQAQALSELDDQALGAELTEMYDHRLGAMQPCAGRHLYPLVGVWPDRLYVERLVAVGDAAVGMHPVTAHGFNLGLHGVDTLANALSERQAHGGDLADRSVLAAYQRRQQRASLPLYLATATVVGLYTNDHLPARVLRRSVLRLADRLPPFKRLAAAQLTGELRLPEPLQALKRLAGR